MADVDWSGPYAGAQVMDNVTNTNNINGNISGAATWTHTVGAGQNPLRWKGSYNITPAAGGSWTLTGSPTNRFRYQPNGTADTWKACAAWTAYILTSNAGSPHTCQYVDSYYVCMGHLNTGALTFTNDAIIYPCTGPAWGFYMGQSGAAAQSIDSLYVYGQRAVNGPAFTLVGTQALTITNLKAVNCHVGIGFSTTGVSTITNVLLRNCYQPWNSNPVTGSVLTRFVIVGQLALSTMTLAAPNAITVDEAYGSGVCGSNSIFTNTGTGLPTVSNGVFCPTSIGVTSIVLQKVISSHNDVMPLGRHTNGAIYFGTSDGDAIGGHNGAMCITVGADLDDYATALMAFDATDGAVTSAEVPMGYQLLSANRTNAEAVFHKPTTWSGVSATVAGGNVTFAGTSGIKCKSKVVIALSSGGTPILETPWQYDGFLDQAKRTDFTLPVTAHTPVIAESNLPAGVTLWYRLKGEDPCGRPFYSAWDSFTTTAAGGGTTGPMIGDSLFLKKVA